MMIAAARGRGSLVVKCDFARFHSNFEGESPESGQGRPTSLSFPPTSREDLRLNGYLEYPNAAKGLYIYKHSCLIQDSNPGPTGPQGTLNSRRVTGPLVWKGKRGGRRLTPQSVFPLNWVGTEPNRTVTCMVLKATSNDRRHFALRHDEFHGP
ncbi:uncharacterized protein TNCV_3682241 [Trichonephila clavipes]|uniref:Uncharacterized protein n=1 Tax=Trichonephila clavipes TaxID=2585209 RepID=A0A8X6V1W6_TRICX|nr:uncharacterized protein TNCV_3682241 [Trichonephila clavipes]